MRTATLVLVAYLFCVIVGAVWRLMPTSFIRDAVPDIGALTAAYLGLTARRGSAGAVGGSVVLGYLVDLISGAPAGLNAMTLGLTALVARGVQQRILVRGATMTMGFSALVARGVQQRILVRGATMTMGFSAFVALIAGVGGLMIRVVYGVPRASFALELKYIALVTVATTLVGPLVWRVFRRIDAAFARTHRERDAALEGISP